MLSINRHIIFFLLIISLVSAPRIFAEEERKRTHQIKQDQSKDRMKTEIALGNEIAERIIAKFGLYQNDNLTHYVNLVGNSLALLTERPELQFAFGVLDTEIICTFSTPGGIILITKGAIGIMDDEAQLAGVLAHEIIHVVRNHTINELDLGEGGSSAMSGLAHLISGASSPIATVFSVSRDHETEDERKDLARHRISRTVIDEAMDILLEEGYSKEDVFEADTEAVILSARLGYDPTGLSRYLEGIRNVDNDELTLYSTISLPVEERIRRMRKAIEEDKLPVENTIKGRDRFFNYKKEKAQLF